LTIQLEIGRHSPNDVPMTVKVNVPGGVRLVGGQATEVIVDDRNEVVSRVLTLQVDEVPSTDVVVTVDASTAGAGAHATAAYRFGRPEPTLQPPLRGNPLVVNGRSFGQPIPLAPPTSPK
jgi:hypothetical protein